MGSCFRDALRFYDQARMLMKHYVFRCSVKSCAQLVFDAIIKCLKTWCFESSSGSFAELGIVRRVAAWIFGADRSTIRSMAIDLGPLGFPELTDYEDGWLRFAVIELVDVWCPAIGIRKMPITLEAFIYSKDLGDRVISAAYTKARGWSGWRMKSGVMPLREFRGDAFRHGAWFFDRASRGVSTMPPLGVVQEGIDDDWTGVEDAFWPGNVLPTGCVKSPGR